MNVQFRWQFRQQALSAVLNIAGFKPLLKRGDCQASEQLRILPCLDAQGKNQGTQPAHKGRHAGTRGQPLGQFAFPAPCQGRACAACGQGRDKGSATGHSRNLKISFFRRAGAVAQYAKAAAHGRNAPVFIRIACGGKHQDFAVYVVRRAGSALKAYTLIPQHVLQGSVVCWRIVALQHQNQCRIAGQKASQFSLPDLSQPDQQAIQPVEAEKERGFCARKFP